MHPGLHPDDSLGRASQASRASHAPAVRRGEPAPATSPAGSDFGICGCWRQRQEKAGEALLGPILPLQEGPRPALQSLAGAKEAVRSIRQRKTSGSSKASWASEVGGAQGRRGCWLAGSSFCCPRASWSLPGQEPQAPERLKPGESKLGLSEKGLVEQGWAQSPLGSGLGNNSP